MTNVKEIKKKVESLLPPNANVSKIELEGPEISIYTKNPKVFYENDRIVKTLVSSLKKRINLRSDSSLLMPKKEAEKIIKTIIPEDAGITDIKFDDTFNQVWIEAIKFGLIIGKGGENIRRVMLETGWAPKPLRAPLKPSDTLKGIRHHLWKSSNERKKLLKSAAEKIYQDPKAGKNYVTVKFLGAARHVGRSCLLVETNNSKVIVDCGVNFSLDPNEMYPRLDSLGFPLSEVDAVIVSHAHMDHSGFIPYLYAMGCKAPLYCTEPTRDLMTMLQLDSIRIWAKEHEGKKTNPPYSETHVKDMLKYVIPVEYNEVTDITPDLRLTLYDAGHILGSASIHLHEGTSDYNLVYTADMKYGFTRLFNPANNQFPRCEAIIQECTYGGHKDYQMSRKETEAKLLRIINETVNQGGNVLIPVFGVGRGQELMLVLEQFHREGKLNKNAKIYVDGMVKEVAAIHTAYPNYLKANIRTRTMRNDSPFVSDIFKTTDHAGRADVLKEGSNVIISTSGMMVGGPVIDYFKKMAEDPKNTLVFVGYQADGTLGRRIRNGAKEIPMTDDKGKLKSLKINMRIEATTGFSSHSDRKELVNYLSRIRPKIKRILINHGEERNTVNLANFYERTFKIESYAPRVMDSLRLK